MTGTPFPVDPVLTGISIAYRNGEFIADGVLPRLAPLLATQQFKYNAFPLAEAITIPDTRVGRKGVPTTVEFTSEEKAAFTKDYGLDDLIPIDDIKQGLASGYDPRSFATERLTDLVLLDREKRVADKVFTAATYPVANRETLSSTSQWSHVDSKPINAIAAAADSMVMRPNIAVMGRKTWTAMRTNPNVLRALTPSGAGDGMANKRAVADLLELDDILVGSSWLNSAKPGQAVQRVRLWGSHCALLRIEKLASSQSQIPTFGWTAQYGGRVSGSIDEPKSGLRGAVRVRVGESVEELIAANDLGYLFTNAAA